MVVIVLIVFLLTEVPKVVLHVWFIVGYIDDSFRVYPVDTNVLSVVLVVKYEHAMEWLLSMYTDMVSDSWDERLIVFIFIMEGIKLFTLVGCLSNFIIYVVMSRKLRSEIVSIFRKPVNRSNAIEMRQM